VLTVRAERAPVQADGAQMIVSERPSGTFTRQVFLGETLDADHIAADYAAGVLTLTIPVREAAKPRNIQVTSSDTKQAVTA
jgi:HSP20 family protein